MNIQREVVEPANQLEPSGASAATLAEQLGAERLAELKKQKFTPEGRQERIAKALAALDEEISIPLPIETLRQIVEDPDLADQF